VQRDRGGLLLCLTLVAAQRGPRPATRYAFGRPNFVMSWPPTVEETRSPKIIGRLISQATVADLPRATWNYWDMKLVPPNNATPTSTLRSP
jgi:hypothetical protein